MRWLGAILAASLVAGCGTATDAGAVRPLPEPTAERRSEELPGDQVRLWPHSAEVEQGVHYRMTSYTHCGLDHMFDFDGSFWEVASRPDDVRGEVLGDPDDDGIVTLVDPDTAVYESSLGAEFRLTRVDGPRDVNYCE